MKIYATLGSGMVNPEEFLGTDIWIEFEDTSCSPSNPYRYIYIRFVRYAHDNDIFPGYLVHRVCSHDLFGAENISDATRRSFIVSGLTVGISLRTHKFTDGTLVPTGNYLTTEEILMMLPPEEK